MVDANPGQDRNADGHTTRCSTGANTPSKDVYTPTGLAKHPVAYVSRGKLSETTFVGGVDFDQLTERVAEVERLADAARQAIQVVADAALRAINHRVATRKTVVDRMGATRDVQLGIQRMLNPGPSPADETRTDLQRESELYKAALERVLGGANENDPAVKMPRTRLEYAKLKLEQSLHQRHEMDEKS
ncbi:uncharacterized protein MYCGRDRAFT_97968 [Zymoseptoria tritici IPO323]|uniref:Uncharacterized protein n=1 Tax=Zymoseptoria tritici (strain CBS 115943 / IPO323) TaxID=336722 RepID=F9XRX5_ZYMTI|nr:uncharacterized protein MYCGRDRAFT_97968 [Zymoseptoria tritici IPO323]EGP82024.1 hypothetical protein MYCGRDRAFT_97968 [Zymoseptoria tritici IPO323]